MLSKEWLIEKITTFLRMDESNRMTGVDGLLMFEPDILVGICSGNDPIFEEYKRVVGPFHLTPFEAFKKYCNLYQIKPVDLHNLSVIAYILPINEKTKAENFEYSKDWPSERWAHTRLYGEKANQKLQKFLVRELEKEFGLIALAPMTEKKLFKIYRKHDKTRQGVWASSWSHRHVCFACGLGSFGLSDGFINEKGKAMRCGSLIVNFKLPTDADKRPLDPYAYCTNCGDCIKRCPVNAISFEGGHDKQSCSEKVMSTIPYINEHYNISIYSCGLCQVNVSCSNGIPKE